MLKKKYVSSILAVIITTMASGAAYADDAMAALKLQENKYIVFGIALLLGAAAVGGAIGQSRAAVAALDGIGRNPASADKMFTPFLLSLVLIESLVIYALLLAFLLYFKL